MSVYGTCPPKEGVTAISKLKQLVIRTWDIILSKFSSDGDRRLHAAAIMVLEACGLRYCMGLAVTVTMKTKSINHKIEVTLQRVFFNFFCCIT